MDERRSVLVLGGTGLVGSECIRLLLADDSCANVVVLARKSATETFPDKLQWHSVDFDNLESQSELFAVDQIICALGTTVRKTPSRDVYRKVDYEYPLLAARLGLATGASHYLVVTAIGANSKSPIFYNRLKGELEDGLALLDYPSVTIARPSVLIGERAEPRLSEKIAWKLSFLTPKKYKPVKASSVARALVNAGRLNAPGLRIIPNEEIEAAAAI